MVGADMEFEDLDGFETWRGGQEAKAEGSEDGDGVGELVESRGGRPRRPKAQSLSARDLHGFELRKEQVDAYKRFEPVLKEEERERVSRWMRFACEYAPSSSTAANGTASVQTEGEASTSEGTCSSDLTQEDMNKLASSVNFVLRSFAKTKERERRRRMREDQEATTTTTTTTTMLNRDGDGLAEVVDVAIRELRMLVQSGVPSQARGVLWRVFLQVDDARAGEPGGEDVLGGLGWGTREAYKFLCDGRNFAAGEDPSAAFLKVIDKDIPRTLPAHKQASEFVQSGSLRRILVAYCRHHPEVGYCQGMNFVAGLFLLIMTSGAGGDSDASEMSGLESECYWCFDALCGKVLKRYYTEDILEVQVDQLVLQQLLEEKFPTVATQMDNLGVSLACVSSSWLLCCFANALPWTTLLRTWDVLLFPDHHGDGSAEDSSLLFKFTLALVDIHSRSLIQCKDPTQLIVLLQSMPVQSFDSSQLVTIACQGFADVDEGKLDPLRRLYRPIVTQTFGRGMGGSEPDDPNPALETPEAARVRERLGLRPLEGRQEMSDVADEGSLSDRSASSVGQGSARSAGSASARALRRRLLGSHGSFGLLSPFQRHGHVRRNVSTGGIPIAPGGKHSDNPNGHDALNDQVLQLTSVKYYLEKQVVDLIGVVARMNKDLRERDAAAGENDRVLAQVSFEGKGESEERAEGDLRVLPPSHPPLRLLLKERTDSSSLSLSLSGGAAELEAAGVCGRAGEGTDAKAGAAEEQGRLGADAAGENHQAARGDPKAEECGGEPQGKARAAVPEAQHLLQEQGRRRRWWWRRGRGSGRGRRAGGGSRGGQVIVEEEKREKKIVYVLYITQKTCALLSSLVIAAIPISPSPSVPVHVPPLLAELVPQLLARHVVPLAVLPQEQQVHVRVGHQKVLLVGAVHRPPGGGGLGGVQIVLLDESDAGSLDPPLARPVLRRGQHVVAVHKRVHLLRRPFVHVLHLSGFRVLLKPTNHTGPAVPPVHDALTQSVLWLLPHHRTLLFSLVLHVPLDGQNLIAHQGSSLIVLRIDRPLQFRPQRKKLHHDLPIV